MRIGQRNGLRRKLLSAAVAACFVGELVYANPVGPAVVNGQASFATQGTTLSVTNTPGAIINWQQFSIQANEATRFIQQSAASAVLNRVVGVDSSRILGTLQSNGRVFLINPNGILFGAGARIDVAGLVASTLKLSNDDFIAGRMNFVGDAGKPAAVINQGRITAAQGGHVYLIGSAVDNQGVITAPNGDLVLAAGHSVRVTEGTSPGVQVEILAPADRTLNMSELVYSPRGIYAGLVRNSGVIRADSVVRGPDGSITLKASHALALESGGRISANGLDGGRIVMEAQQAAIGGSVQALGSAGAIELSAREITVQGELHSAGELTLSTENLTVVNGSVRVATGAMAISGNFVQTGGSVVPGASVISVGGNWMRAGGIFNAGTSTVMFKDATKPSTISGDNTFYNFMSVTPAKQLFFEGGATQTVLGAFTIKGEKFKLIDLRSTDQGGQQWRLDPRGPVDVKFVHLGDAWNIGPTLIKALPSNSYGNNTGWDTDPVWSALGPGNWSTDANWDTGLRPGAADTVTFNATSVQNSTVDAGFAGTIANLNINAGYTGTINLARSLTVNSAYTQADGNFSGGSSAMTVTGNFTLSGGTFSSTSGTLTAGGAWTHTAGGTFNHNNGTVLVTGNTSTWDVTGTETFNNLTVAKVNGQTLTIGAGDTLFTGGAFAHNDGLISTGTIQAEGAVTVGGGADGGTALLSFTGTANQTYTQTGNAMDGLVTINKASGTVTLASAATWNAASQNLTVTSGTLDLAGFALDTRTLTLAPAGTLLQGSGTITAIDLSNAGTFSGGSAPITLSGNMTLSGGTFTSTSGTLTFENNWTHTGGGTFNHNNGTVSWSSGNTTFDVNGSETFNHLTIDCLGAVNCGASAMVIGAGDSLIVLGTFTHSDGTVRTGTVEARGNVVVNSFADGGTALLSFTGTANQTYTQTGNAMDGLVTINKASGTVTLASAATWNAASQNLTVTSGTLDLAGFALDTRTLTLAPAGTLLQGSGTITAIDLSNAGTFSGGSAPITLSGNMTLSGGTFTSTSGTLTFENNWTHTGGGTFNHNNGTVSWSSGNTTFDVNGSETFNHLTIDCLGAVNCGASAMVIGAGDSLIVLGTFTHSDGSVRTGTVEARGNVVVNSLADGGTALLSFTGTANQTYTQSGNAMDGLVTVNKASGTVTLASATTWNAASQNLTVTNGTLDMAAFDLSTGALTLASAGTVLQGSGAITATNLSNAGTFSGGSAPITLSGNLTLSGGTFTSTSGTLTVPGAWTHTAGGIFNHNNGTVVATGGTTTWDVTSTEAFNNFTVNKPGATLIISAGDAIIVEGAFNQTVGAINTGTIQAQGAVTAGAGALGGTGLLSFTGTADQAYTQIGDAMNGLVTVNKASGTVSLASATTWNSGAQNLTVTSGTLDLAGNNLSTGVMTVGAAGTVLQGAGTITATNLSNAGTFSGGSAPITLSTNLTLSGGSFTSTSGTLTVGGNWTHTAGGTFAHNGGTVLANVASVTIWDVAGTETFNNITVNKPGGGSIGIGAGDTLIVEGAFNQTAGALNFGTVQAQGAVTVGAGAIGGIALLAFAGTADQTYTQIGDVMNGLVTVNKASGTVSLASATTWNSGGQNLTVASGTLDLVGNNLSTGALTVAAAGTLQLQGSETITAGSVALNAGSTVRYNGTAPSFTLKNFAYSNLTIDGGAATVFTFPANLTTLNTLTLNNSITSLAGFNLTATTLANNAILRMQGNEAVSITNMDTNSGLVQYVGDGAGGLNSFSIKDFGAADYFNLTINGVSGSETFSVAAPLKLNGALTHTTGTLNLGANLTTAAGAISSNDAVNLTTNVLIDTTDAGALPAGASMSFAGVMTANSTSSFATGANTITLTNAGNDFQGAVLLTNSGANNVALIDTNALILGASTVGGTLSATAGAGGAGALTQSGALTASALTATAAGGIALATFANDVGTVSLTNTTSGNVAYLTNRAAGVTLTGSNTTGSLSAIEQGAGGLIVGAAGIDTGAGDLVLAANGGGLAVSGAITSASGNVTLSAGGNVVISNDVTTAGNLQFTSSGDININPAVPITVSGSDVTLTGASLNLGNPAAVASLTLSAVDRLTLNATQALNIRGGAAVGAFARVEGTGITVNADTLLFAGGSGAGAYGAVVANAGNVMLNSTTSITFIAGAGANADGVLSAPLWNVVVTTPLCVGCDLLSVDPFTNPPSEAGIHALTVSGLAAASPPIIILPVDPAPPVILESALVIPQPAAEQQMGIEDLWEAALECGNRNGYASATSSAVRRQALSACLGADAGLVEIKPPGGV